MINDSVGITAFGFFYIFFFGSTCYTNDLRGTVLRNIVINKWWKQLFALSNGFANKQKVAKPNGENVNQWERQVITNLNARVSIGTVNKPKVAELNDANSK